MNVENISVDKLKLEVAQLQGWQLQYDDDGRKCQVTRPDGSIVENPYFSSWIDADMVDRVLPAYTTSIDAAMTAVLSKGYLPDMSPIRNGLNDFGILRINIVKFTASAVLCRYESEWAIDMGNQMEVPIEGIATALCATLVYAEKIRPHGEVNW